MADEKKKLSTQDILAMARAQSGGGGGKKQESPPGGEAEAAAVGDSAPAAPAASSETPKSTADILAAARAQKKQAAAPAGGAAPKSTADILAAARAQSGAKAASGTVAGEDKPSAKPKPAPKTVSEGDLPPVEEMVKAVAGTGAAQPVTKAKTKTPVIPVRPAKPAPKAEEPRRNFLVSLVATPFALAWTLMALMGGGFTLAVARFMMPNVLVEPPSKFKIGPPTDYGFGTVSTKWKSQFGVWIVHTEYQGQKEIFALASVCTHLGCTPNWLEGEQKFKCPCHGSGFYINGINFEGPAPRPLERVGLSLGADGMLEVDKSVKFQEELGQWSDDTSFVTV